MNVFSIKNAYKSYIILSAMILLCILATVYTNSEVKSSQKKELIMIFNDINSKISVRLHAHAQLLRSGAAYFAASDTITRAEWQLFNLREKVNYNLPGIQGVGYAHIVPKEQLQQHIQQIRAEGFTCYTIKPEGEREIYTSIIYIEPFTARNQRAFGYDMYSEPVRRKAMQLSCDSDLAVLTSKVTLVQESNEDVQAGTLMYVPVYKKDMPINTVDQRRAALQGWVYSPYRMNDLMHGILGRWDTKNNERIHLRIYSDSISLHHLLYDSQANDSRNHNHDNLHNVALNIVFNGSKWVLLFSHEKLKFSFLHNNAYIVLFCGIIISLLFFFLSLLLFNTKKRAEQIAQKLTSEVIENKERFSVLLNSTAEAIYGINTKGNCTFANAAFLHIMGYESMDNILGKNMHQLNHYSFANGKVYHEHDCKVYQSFSTGSEVHVDDEVFWRADGTCFPVEYWAHPFYVNGKIDGAVVSFVDITKRINTEKSLRKSEESFRLLNSVFTQMIRLQNLESVYKLIVNSLSSNIADCVILFVSIDEQKSETCLEAFAGLDNAMQKRIFDAMGYSLVGKHFRLQTEMNESFRTEKLKHFEGGFAEFSKSALPPLIIKSVERIVGIHKVYTIGICNDEKLLAAIYFFTFNKKDITQISFIETFAKQIGIVLQMKIAEQALKTSEERFRLLADNSQNIIFRISLPAGKYEYISASIERISGYTQQDFYDNPMLIGKIIHHDYFEQFYDNWLRILNSDVEEFYEYKVFDKNRSERWVLQRNTLIRNNKGKAIALEGSITDITARKKAEMRIAESEKKLKEIFDNSLDNIFVIEVFPNYNFKISTINLAFQKAMNRSKQDIEGQFIDDFYAHEMAKTIAANYKQCAQSGKTVTFEEAIQLENNVVHYSTILSPMFDEFGKVFKIIGMSRNITQSKEAELTLKHNQLVLQELNVTKDKLFSIIAHDLKNPFAALLSSAELLQLFIEMNDMAKIKSKAEMILKSAKQGYNLLQNLLEWSHSQRGLIILNIKQIELRSVVNTCIDLVNLSASNKNIMVINDVSNQVMANADVELITTVIRNLISNAIKFTNQNGSVQINAVEYVHEIEVSITDNGIGIDSETINKLFRIGENISKAGTSGERGTGLGLILCHEFVAKHGGRIWVESSVGKGSSFKFTIPLHIDR